MSDLLKRVGAAAAGAKLAQEAAQIVVAERDETIVKLAGLGVPYRRIAEHAGLSAARVAQIVGRNA